MTAPDHPNDSAYDASTRDMPAGSTARKPIAAATHIREGPGTRIGPYKLLQLIGEGGFGSVFLAQQEQPVQRRVALKIIKLGMDTDQVVARFGQERQALALMDHPNIARVFDAGATDTGRPYFVMEMVKGDPIVQYCDQNKVGIPERLELFAQVCQAVQHAHTKGIIHRDLKPSNILVSVQDGAPSAKVIDFGIAKATISKLAEQTVFTEHSQLIGTPEYMSPEQAEGSLDIDTRTDIYSLGVLLYELLTGTTPFSSKTLRSAAYGEIQRIIREVEPPKPSTRISQSSDTVANIAAHRHTEPRKLGTMVRGELDWIVMRAMEKDRTRRYQTANALAADIHRYLSGEAVVAAPPSAAYRAHKFIRRNRLAVGAGAAVFAALILGFAGTAWQARKAAQQRDVAREAEHQQTLLRERAETARQRSELIAQFMSDTLGGVGPSVALGRDTAMLKEMMDAAAARIDRGELKEAPEAELRLRQTIGSIYTDLTLYADATRMLEPAATLARSLHPGDDLTTAAALDTLAQLRYLQNDLDRAEPLFVESFEMKKRLLPADHKELASSLTSLGALDRTRGDWAGAERRWRQALDMTRRLYSGDHPEIASALGNVALAENNLGKSVDAESHSRQSLEMLRRIHSGAHPETAMNLGNLAAILMNRGDFAQANPLFRESLDMSRRLYPGDNRQVATAANNFGVLLRKQGDFANAAALIREALAMRRRLNKGDHPAVANSLGELAGTLLDLADPASAEPLARESAQLEERLRGKDSWTTGYAHLQLGRALLALKRLSDAEPELFEAHRVLTTKPAPPQLPRQSFEELVKLYQEWDKADPGKGHDAKAAEWRQKLDALPKPANK